MRKDDITRIARKLWNTYHERDPVKMCKMLGIQIGELPLGKGKNAIKGMIRKDARCYTIIVNSDLPKRERELVLFHEIAHYILRHATAMGTCTCTTLNPVDDGTAEARMEIEANEFLVEYLMDTEETMETLKRTDSFYETASIMRVTPDLMAFKWRMLKYYQLVSGQCPIDARSDCMGKIGCGDEYASNSWDEYGFYDYCDYT